ncbi:hypothetical protein [Spirosoma sp. KNUC1025]|uniref:hypothetical protein n=1 Tax=Spirosoma sp. KNUC1025 TaxID=2894082 RepID=UPI0038707916|nr:hypothetical protein LN737_00525 [Spirosoma sp. KNUC1025]
MEITGFTVELLLGAPNPFGRINLTFRNGSTITKDYNLETFGVVIQMLRIDTVFYDQVQDKYFTRLGQGVTTIARR